VEEDTSPETPSPVGRVWGGDGEVLSPHPTPLGACGDSILVPSGLDRY